MNHSILVVDDNHINRLFLQALLTKNGCHVTLAEDGFKAFDLCQEQHFDLVFMDIRMHGMDGIATSKKLRSTGFNQPIIGVSAERIDDHHDCFTQTLLKPLAVDDVLHCVSSLNTTGKLPYDEEKALASAHGDQDIMLHIRSMFIEQLAGQIKAAESLIHKQDVVALQDHLHHVLGGAQMCAAERFCECILAYKAAIKSEGIGAENSLGLWNNITQEVKTLLDVA